MQLKRTLMLIALLSLALTLANPAATQLLDEAQAVADEARQASGTPHPDQPLWAEALRLGREALALDPNEPDILHFLAETYAAVGWHIRAWESWRDYLAVVHELRPEELEQAIRMGHQLGYARYLAEDYGGSLRYYEAVIFLEPDDVQSHVWAGRIYLESGEPQAATLHYRQVLELDPNDARAAYLLRVAEDQLSRYGADAPQAFYSGVSLYLLDKKFPARLRFIAATEADPDHAPSWAWLARTRFEQDSYHLAASAYERALELDPTNESYQASYREALQRSSP